MSEEFYDLRYPRPFWIRAGRQLMIILGSFARWLWEDMLREHPILSLLYLIGAYILWAVISFNVHRVTLNTLLTLHTLSLLPLSDGVWWQSNWSKLLLILAGLAIVQTIFAAGAAYPAEEDLKREQAELRERQRPPGFNLRSIFLVNGRISQMAWSPDGKVLALNGDNIFLWQPETHVVQCAIPRRTASMSWTPDGLELATLSYDGKNKQLDFWNSLTGANRYSPFNVDSIRNADSITWLSNGQILELTSKDNNLSVLNVGTGQTLILSNSSIKEMPVVAFSPDGQMLAVLSQDDLRIWRIDTGELLVTYSEGFTYNSYLTLASSPNGRVLASSTRSVISLWDLLKKRKIGTLEQDSGIVCLSFSSDSRLLASKGYKYTHGYTQGIIKLWRTDIWELVATLDESYYYGRGLAFHPVKANILATSGRQDTIARIWELDLSQLLADPWTQPGLLSAQSGALWSPKNIARLPAPPGVTAKPPVMPGAAPHSIEAAKKEPASQSNTYSSPLPNSLSSSPVVEKKRPPVPILARYRNARVVLVGDSGVGKSGLGLVLSNQPFAPTESTHGRHVWTFDSRAVDLGAGRKETHETLLWDLAGQPGYRLIHQLHLNEVTVALVVFDARSETDPFAGVAHWERALRMAQQAQGSAALPLKKFLVAARMDRSGIGVSRARIENMLREADFAGSFETSAKDGRGIQELKAAIQAAIDWESLPFVSSSLLFQQIKDFLVAEKEAGRVLSSVDDLYRTFLRTANAPRESEDLLSQFEVCIGRVESRGLIRRLSFGNLVLLQPELLDAYASALINVVRDEPDGLGSISEERVLAAQFSVPQEERLRNREQEKVLMIAMIEDLLRYELALREQAEDGQYLVFPSQSTRENPNLPDPEGKAATLSFEGPVQNIYATLAIRLSHSGLFRKKDLWKNAITYTTLRGGTCGMFLQHSGDGQGSLTLFFDHVVNAERRSDFEAYVVTHLQRKALPESIRRSRVVACRFCQTLVTGEAIQKRRALHFDWLTCPVCDNRVSLLEQEEQVNVASSPAVQRMDEQADRARDRQAAASVVQGKQKTKDFDVFLCHHGVDKPTVKRIGEQLKQQGLLPWLDEWELRPGLPWQQALEEQITNIKSAAVFVGQTGMGPWQSFEMRALLDQFVERSLPVIPVLLPNAPREPKLPLFLKGMAWVDFRVSGPEPLQRLLWGITGNREYGSP